MTQKEAIALAGAMRPNGLPEELLSRFLAELEGRVETEIHAGTGRKKPTFVHTKNPRFSVPAPYDRLYWTYLVAMIDLTVGDMESYALSHALFNEAYTAYARYYQRTGGH